MSKTEALCATLFFCALLALPGVGGLAGLGLDSTEKRTPAPWPGGGDDFFRQLAAALGDRLAWRGRAIEIDARLDLAVFRDSPRPRDVWLGEGDWLFLSGFWRHPCIQSDLDATAVVEHLGRVAGLVEASGRRFRLAVAPDKLSIEGQRLGAKLERLPACGPAKRRAVEAALRGGAVPGAVDLWTPLRRRRGTEALYYRGDIHWRPAAAQVLVRELVESLRPGLWRDDARWEGYPAGRRAGTLAYLGIPAFEAARGATVRRPETRVLELVEEEWRDGAWAPREPRLELDGGRLSAATIERLGTPRIRWRTAGGERLEERTAVIHDSFAWDALPGLSEYLADARLLTWSQGVTDLAAADLRWAETVVVESVEYVLYSRVAQLYGVALRALSPAEPTPLDVRRRPLRESGRDAFVVTTPEPDGTAARTLVLDIASPQPARLRVASWIGRRAQPKRSVWVSRGPPQLVAIDLDAGVDRLMLSSGRAAIDVRRAWLYPTPASVRGEKKTISLDVDSGASCASGTVIQPRRSCAAAISLQRPWLSSQMLALQERLSSRLFSQSACRRL